MVRYSTHKTKSARPKAEHLPPAVTNPHNLNADNVRNRHTVAFKKRLTVLELSRFMRTLRVTQLVNDKYALPVHPDKLSYVKNHPEIFKPLPDGNFEII